MMTILRVQGMKCQHCVATVKKTLEDLGATAVEIDLVNGEVRYAGELDETAVRQVIAGKGFAVVD